MRCTEETLIPATAAMAAAVQWVVSPGGSPWVRATTRSAISAAKGGMRDRRVLSRNKPSTPASMNRSCQRQTAVLLLPVRRMIAFVPSPAVLKSTIRARQTCFCGLFRSATIASSRTRSAALTVTMMPVRIPQVRISASQEESQTGLFRQILSTSL
jgi:hypothetical protein